MKPLARNYKSTPRRKPDNYRTCIECGKAKLSSTTKQHTKRCGRCARLRREANGWKIRPHPLADE